DIDIGASFEGGDGGQGVPVVRGADDHDVEVLRLEHRAEVGEGRGAALGAFLDLVGGGAEHLAVHVAQGGHFDVGFAHGVAAVDHAVPAAADDAEAVGLGLVGGNSGFGGQGGSGGGGGGQEFAAVHGRDPRKWCFAVSASHS